MTKVAPRKRITTTSWVKENLFNNWYNSVITIVALSGFVFALVSLLGWIFASDYLIIRRNLTLFMVGRYPRDELWRPWVSGYLLMGGFGLGSGMLWKSAEADAQSKGLPTEPHSWLDLLRRFWAVIAILVFFVSFARSVTPYLALAAAFATFFLAREIGRRLNATMRNRVLYFAGLLGLLSLVVLAGSSGLGAMMVGALLGAWTLAETRQVFEAKHRWATAISRLSGLVVGVVVWQGMIVLDIEGFGWDHWGGLHLTLFVTVIGVGAGFPFGILLALGRQSKLPVIKGASVIFIEFVRGVPLISLLFLSSWMLPLLFPRNFDVPGQLTRAMIVITAFSAAYIAEIVRGGLQAVPRGQVEAAQASGMSASAIQRLIVLPQALRAVIPAMVGQFISLFKDTSLLSILKIGELLHISRVANSQPEFLGEGLAAITLPFVALGFWAIAYTFSKESRRFEKKLGVGIR